MNEPIKRRNLFPVSLPAALPEAAISAVAARNGFPDPTVREIPALASQPVGTRRQRQPTGRIRQFNTRLRQETLDVIYGEANGRNIPVAQVIEEAIEALKRQRM